MFSERIRRAFAVAALLSGVASVGADATSHTVFAAISDWGGTGPTNISDFWVPQLLSLGGMCHTSDNNSTRGTFAYPSNTLTFPLRPCVY